MRRAFSLALLVGISAALSAKAQVTPPNIIVILADDLGYGDVGYNGCSDIPTPNIDALVTNGVRCSNGYSTHPFCSPSRAALLTGRYQQRFGHENQPLEDGHNERLGLPMSEVLLPQLLKPAGYVCGALGKWHLGAALNFHPAQRGFDEFYGFLDGSSDYLNATLLRGETRVKETRYLTDAFTEEAESFITRHASQPFFLYLAYNAPHAPYQATQEYLDRVSYITDPDRQTYAAMVVALDDGVGAVAQTLQSLNLLNNTLIFFLSDNGAPDLPFTEVSNLPLRGFKGDVYEGGIHVPFVIQWSGQVPASAVYAPLVSSLDIVATATAVAGVTLPTDRVYDGVNLIPYLTGQQTSPIRTLVWRWFGLGAETGPPGCLDTIYAIRRGSLKLVQENVTTNPALYNLPADVGETTDLSAIDPVDVTALTQLYNQWNSNTVPPLWQDETDFLRAMAPNLVLAGDWDGFNKDDLTLPWAMPRLSGPDEYGTPDGFNWFISTVHTASNGGDTTPGLHTFTLIGGNSYKRQWGGVTIEIDATNALPYFSGVNLGPTNNITLDEGYYYSFRVLDPAQPTPDSLILGVMKTSAPPVAVSWVGQTPAIPRNLRKNTPTCAGRVIALLLPTWSRQPARAPVTPLPYRRNLPAPSCYTPLSLPRWRLLPS